MKDPYEVGYDGGALFETGSWDDDDDVGTPEELNPRSRGHQLRLTERDITLIRFLTRYQFSTMHALCTLTHSTPDSLRKRLTQLRAAGLVLADRTPAGRVWHASQDGIALVGLDFTEKAIISPSTVHHTVAVAELAAHLEAEHANAKDVLGLGASFPVSMRPLSGARGDDGSGFTFGQVCISEREVRQSQQRFHAGKSTADLRSSVLQAAADPEAPEMEPGNENLLIVYGNGGVTGQHVPDLVVTRPRAADGTPQHVAVEFERTQKSRDEVERILMGFRDHGSMFAKLVYFTPSRSIANHVSNVAEDIGYERLEVRKFTPSTLGHSQQ